MKTNGFTSIEERAVYRICRPIIEKAEHAARVLMNVDEDTVDLNHGRGSVAVDSYAFGNNASADSTYTGALLFDPGSRKLRSMDVIVEQGGVEKRYQVESRRKWFGLGDEILHITEGLNKVTYNMDTGAMTHMCLGSWG